MKTYIKPTVEIESIMMQDVILSSIAINDSEKDFEDCDEVL